MRETDIHAELERMLQQRGYQMGTIGRLTAGDKLKRQTKKIPDQDWQNPHVFSENLNDLFKWAVICLAKMNVIPKDSEDTPYTSRFVPMQGALSHVIASDSAVQRKVHEIRSEFWSSQEAPFPSQKIGQVAALDKAKEWVEKLFLEDSENYGRGRKYISLAVVLEYADDPDIENSLYMHLARTAMSWDVAQSGGTYLNGEVSGREFLEKIAAIIPKDGVRTTHRSLRLCNIDGEDEPLIALRGSDGWTYPWKAAYKSNIYHLWQECQALADYTKKWTGAEAFEYVLTNIVPSMGANIEWSNLRDPRANLTIKFRCPATKNDVIRTYENATENHVFMRPQSRKLSNQHLAVLQIYHDMPKATWKERIEIFNTWSENHPELKSYKGAAAQQHIASDYRRAVERSKWRYRK